MKSIDDKINDVSILKFNKNVTGYAKKQSLELRFFDIFKTGGIELFGIDKLKSINLKNIELKIIENDNHFLTSHAFKDKYLYEWLEKNI